MIAAAFSLLPLFAAQGLAGSSGGQVHSYAGRFEATVSLDPTGDPLLSVRAHEAPVEPLLNVIAAEAGLGLRGFDKIQDPDPISVYLEEEPLGNALHWILGAAGLRVRVGTKMIEVFAETGPYPERAELFNLAETSFLRALRSGPTHPLAADAEFSLAAIQKDRGDIAGEVKHHNYLIEKHYRSPLVPEAMLLSGRSLARLGIWDESAARFDQLARLERSHPYHATARLELARTLCHLGSPERARLTLDALELSYPTDDSNERRERLLVRARALSLAGEAIDALRALDLAAKYSLEGAEDPEVLELRALAMESAGHAGQASVAWLGYAQAAEGSFKAAAFERAARLAHETGDELGTLFIHELAKDAGFAKATEDAAAAARARLGLPQENLAALPSEQQLERAQALMARGLTAEAVRALEPLFRLRGRLVRETRLAVGLEYAKALDEEDRTERAIEVLGETAAVLDKQSLRKQVYLFAADLLERRGRFADALDALEGKL